MKSLESEFKAIDRPANIALFIHIPVFGILSLYLDDLPEEGNLKSLVTLTWFVGFFGVMLYLCLYIFKRKRSCMIAHGLKCGKCGYIPLPGGFINFALKNHQCRKCKAPLEIVAEPAGAGQPDNPPVKL
ncbi:hypothetical protein QEH59_18215 [Coraliomargarita sp. SDUM461004]|uniref:SoxR reducing system RseC family protein n=1 Tax=Thalassobacterium sedimentorum TaxID=3041258 RepID=A0ABU1ARH7_9BACT|nr:hypothetical protein [Coraliomargarita sp. SDUM461004]MDQ8196371.1 hypothetical protein [Coraliomargarita sp. SDUM461004]